MATCSRTPHSAERETADRSLFYACEPLACTIHVDTSQFDECSPSLSDTPLIAISCPAVFVETGGVVPAFLEPENRGTASYANWRERSHLERARRDAERNTTHVSHTTPRSRTTNGKPGRVEKLSDFATGTTPTPAFPDLPAVLRRRRHLDATTDGIPCESPLPGKP